MTDLTDLDFPTPTITCQVTNHCHHPSLWRVTLHCTGCQLRHGVLSCDDHMKTLVAWHRRVGLRDESCAGRPPVNIEHIAAIS